MDADVPREDALTLAAIGVLAYVCCDLFHELAGHGAACLVTGGRAGSVSAFHLQCFGGWQGLVCSAGILANLALAAIAWLVLRHLDRASPHRARFLWLLLAYNAFTGFGNIVTSSLANAGDLANAFRGIGWNWRPWMVAIGFTGYVLALLVVRRCAPLLTWRNILIPYFAVAAAGCAAAVLNTVVGFRSALISGVSTTLGCWGFLLLAPIQRGGAVAGEKLPRSGVWISAAAVFLAGFIFLLGPGHRFR